MNYLQLANAFYEVADHVVDQAIVLSEQCAAGRPAIAVCFILSLSFQRPVTSAKSRRQTAQ